MEVERSLGLEESDDSTRTRSDALRLVVAYAWRYPILSEPRKLASLLV